MSTSILKPRMRMLANLLASTYCFSWPNHAFILGIAGLACEEPSKASLLHVGGQVYNQLAAFRVKDGTLVALQSILPPGSLQVLPMVDFTRRTKKS